MNAPIIETPVTYLEMTDNPNIPDVDLAEYGFKLQKKPDFEVYIQKYQEIGEEYLWVKRYSQSRKAIEDLLNSNKMLLYYLYKNNQIIGMADCSYNEPQTIEINYCGLILSEINTGLGRKFCTKLLHHLWKKKPSRIILETSGFDHPKALKFYMDAGFKIFNKNKKVQFEDYRFTGLCPFYKQNKTTQESYS